MKDKISVIVPVYNVEEYLDECLVSIVNQTYKNLEILVIDDGSTDNSGKMCDDWAKKDKRIKVFHKENGGLSSARNVGLKHATGKWIGFIDSDDYIDVTMYEKMLLNSKDAEMVSCGVYAFSKSEGHKVEYPYKKINSNSDVIKTIFKISDPMVWHRIYLKSYINDLLFIEEVKIAEDYPFIYSYLDKIKNVAHVNESLYYYRQRENSLIHVMDPKKFITSIESLSIANSYLEKYNVFERYNLQSDCICNFYIYKHKLGKNYDYSKYEKIINSYIQKGILKRKIGLKNKFKLIIAIYFTPVYLFFKDCQSRETK